MRNLSIERALLCVTVSCAGCDVLGMDCNNQVEPGITVDVIDATTIERVTGPVLVIARDGVYADTADTPDFVRRLPRTATDTLYWGPFELAWERSGSYTVSVSAPGYEPFTRSAIRITNAGCYTRTLSFHARLQQQS